MKKTIIAILEQRDGHLKKSSFEIASLAATLAQTGDYNVLAVTVGAEIDNLAEIARYGIGRIIHLQHDALALFSASAYKQALAKVIADEHGDFLLLPHTAFGKDIAPKLAVHFQAGILVDCLELSIIGNDHFKGVRPVYAGKAFLETETTSAISIATVRPNIFKPVISQVEPAMETIAIEEPDLACRVTEIKRSEGKIDVSEADIVVSGGRGMKGPEHFHLVEELAAALHGAVGASRAVVDVGWRPHEEQVGQTGKTVSPTLYVACGISGAIQHLAGMSSSKYIVAINKDKDAPIFSVSDYGITGDLFEILPILTEEIKRLQQ